MVVAVYWNQSIYFFWCSLLESDFIVVFEVYWNHSICHGCCSLLLPEHLLWLMQLTGIRAFIAVGAVYWNHSIYCGCFSLMESDFIVVVAVY